MENILMKIMNIIQVGQWHNGYRHGKGILYYKNSTPMYDGYFVNNKFDKYNKKKSSCL